MAGGLSRRAVIALALVLIGGPALAAAPGDMSLGSSRAKVVVEEFASLTCPHCAHFNADIFPAFKKKYVDTGRVRYVLHEFLTPPEEVAAAGWLLARCAGPKRYFAVVDQVFASQSQWGDGNIVDLLGGIAKANGLTQAQFEACVTDQTAIDALNARMNAATEKYQIDATPTFVVNGKKVKAGVMSLDELDAAIAAAGRR